MQLRKNEKGKEERIGKKQKQRGQWRRGEGGEAGELEKEEEEVVNPHCIMWLEETGWGKMTLLD